MLTLIGSVSRLVRDLIWSKLSQGGVIDRIVEVSMKMWRYYKYYTYHVESPGRTECKRGGTGTRGEGSA